MTIKAVFFDLDDTLHDHQKPFSDTMERCFPDFSKDQSVTELYKKLRHYSDIYWVNYTNNKMSLEELRIKRIISALKDFSYNISRSQAAKFQGEYDVALQQISLFKDVPQILNSLKSNGFQIGLITNGPVQHQKNKIKALGLVQYFSTECIFISDEVGIAKPDPRLFELAAQKLSLSANEVLYVGDTWINDIIGPSKAGWNTVWFNHRMREPETDHKPMKEIKSLSSLLTLLEIT
ncbi:HAD family hydrolase [Litchfieldia alkalitelluris]|uniref:HAD family hydrolase n=1 Tax=Litchfieldia alkalitelluris TaxID=304268 RepID=UPI0014738B59|nr:HAD family hydrolase [Litchfieldia alkalitelluris]